MLCHGNIVLTIVSYSPPSLAGCLWECGMAFSCWGNHMAQTGPCAPARCHRAPSHRLHTNSSIWTAERESKRDYLRVFIFGTSSHLIFTMNYVSLFLPLLFVSDANSLLIESRLEADLHDGCSPCPLRWLMRSYIFWTLSCVQHRKATPNRSRMKLLRI